MIYLDNAATTKPCDEAIKQSQKFCEAFFNPSSIYFPAISVAKDVQLARSEILERLGDCGGNLIFTSGATEANNLAIFQATKNKNKAVITSMGEHPSVFNSVKNLENASQKVIYIPLLKSGEIDLVAFENALNNNDVGFVSIMFVNNETGAINPIEKIAKMIKNKSKSIIFHVDAVQAFAKIDFNVKNLDIDLLTISSHKIHGLKGTGALYYKAGLSVKPLAFGGGQEFGLRSGTENVSGICAFAAACKLDGGINPALKERALEIISQLDNIKINGNGVCNILSVSAKGVKAEVVVRMLDEKGIYVSTGSACNSHKADNRVLSSMGVPKEYIEGTNRFSFSKFTTMQDVETAFAAYVEVIKELRGLWEKE